jgi:hypothetical protein
LAGFVGWVIGIVATVNDRGKQFGTAAILAGLVGPLMSFYAILSALVLSLTFGNG